MTDNSAKWIYLFDEIENKKRSVFFRKEFVIDAVENSILNISADSRYKLYINGVYVYSGPVQGNDEYYFYESINVTQYLKLGQNVVAVHVLKFPKDPAGAVNFEIGPLWLSGTTRGGLWVESDNLELNTDSSWKVIEDESYQFVHAEKSKYAGDQEFIDASIRDNRWNEIDYDASHWNNAVIISLASGYKLGGVMYNWQLNPSPLPLQYSRKLSMKSVRSQDPSLDLVDFIDKRSITVPAKTKICFDVDMGENVTVFLNFKAFGSGTVKLSYAESYYQTDGKGRFWKELRSDHTGMFIGEFDTYKLSDQTVSFSPYFYRSFRFLRIEMVSGDQPLGLSDLNFQMTGYPLDITNEPTFSNEDTKWLWDVSERTLLRCMHESYVDCPYYERMQYIMDALLQSVMTYQISADGRLAKKAINDFLATQKVNGLFNCNAPSSVNQIIPGFSLLFVDMIYYFALYQDDLKTVELAMTNIQTMLNYFRQKIDRETGLIANCGYWEFVDWVDEWHDDFGSPMKPTDEINVIYNMYFAYALERVASIYDMLGKSALAADSRVERLTIIEAINTVAYAADRELYQSSPGDTRYAQHTQIWAVLSGSATGDRAAQLMKTCLIDESLLDVSFSMTFYLFRALETVGLYEHANIIWSEWLKLRELDITTWPEDLVQQRSDCHGWGAIAIYEFNAAAMGIKPIDTAWSRIKVAPSAHSLGYIECRIPTIFGDIVASRTKKTNNRWLYQIEVPEKICVDFEFDNIVSVQEDGRKYYIDYIIDAKEEERIESVCHEQSNKS